MSEIPKTVTWDIHRAAQILKTCKHGVVLSGAGVSTPSGIPDFRSPGSGLWTRYDPFGVASLSAFRFSPERFFGWMRPLAQQIAQARPNAAHVALAEMESAGHIHTVITQNIDGLHQRAGAQNVIEVHGSLRSLTCSHCFRQYDALDFLQPYLETGAIPHCPECRHILKPDVILFEEQLPFQPWTLAREACQRSDLIVVVGSSLEVMPVAGLPLEALQRGATLIMINQMPTYLDERANLVFRQDAAEILPRIAEALFHDG